jgi:flagellar hook-length control protein FliK
MQSWERSLIWDVWPEACNFIVVKGRLVISAIPQIGANAAKPAAAVATGSSDIFLQLLTQEFQTSNGLLDPSLSNLNAAQPGMNTVDLNKIDPKAQDGNAPSPAIGNSSPTLKKAIGKDGKEAQSSKADEPTTPVPTVLAATGQVPAAVPIPIQVQPSADVGTNAVASSDDNKGSDKTSTSTTLSFDTANSLGAQHLVSANEKLSGKQAQAIASPVQPKTEGDAGKIPKNSQAGSSTDAAPPVTDAETDAKPAISEIAKSAINDSIAAPKRSEAIAHKGIETAPIIALTPKAITASDSNATNDPTAIAISAALATPNQAVTQAAIPTNQLPDAKLRNGQGSNLATQIADGSEKKTKDNDSSAAIKSASRKDEGQLSQQDGQQTPASGDQQIPVADSAFHSAVVQQLHVAVGTNSVGSHASSPNPKTAVPSNNLQSPLQQNSDTTHDAALPSAAGLLQSVKLVERLGQSELRVGLQVGDMGGIDIRTSMAHNQLTAEISVERPELGHLLEANLPSLQNRLSEHQFQTANIMLQNPTNGSFSGSEQRNRQGDGSQPATPIERIPFARTDSFSRNSVLSSESTETNAGLDIHI